MSEIELKTTDNELANELQSLKIDELQVVRKIKTFDCAHPEVMAMANQAATFVISSGSSIALSLLASWLYDRISSTRKEKSIKINGIELSGDNNNLKVEIHNHIHSTDSKSE